MGSKWKALDDHSLLNCNFNSPEQPCAELKIVVALACCVMNMPQRNAAVAGARMTHELVSIVNEAAVPSHRMVAKEEKLIFCHMCSNQLLFLTTNIWFMLTGSPRMLSKSLPIWFSLH